MPLLAGDIRFARSAVMADVPEGGGPPSAQLLTSGRSNEIFPDISEETRTTGRVEIYQIFSLLRNTDNAPLLGANVILAVPPADPNVSITLLSLKNPFATRQEIARRIESGMAAGSEWGGYLLENHFETMRSIQLLQRPGMQPPTLSKTYVLVVNEGLSSERRQRVRIKTAETQQRIYTEIVNNVLTDFAAQVTTCELFDSLSHDFPGSVPRRSFARQDGKTVVRETVYSDSGMFCSASRLTAATQMNDVWLQTASVYTQIVPNSRTEAALVDQRPSARQTMVLATSPRRIEVGITPHTQRIKIAEENAGQIFVAQLRPLPDPGALFIDFWALGQRYTIYDDGTGRLTGAGGGAVSYLTGAMSFTLKNPPDIGSSICITHGERVGYTDHSGQAGYRAPEFAWATPQAPVKPGSVAVEWMSGGVLRSATDTGAGTLTSTHGAGEIDYATGKIYLRPTAMIDAGGEFKTDFEYSPAITQNFAGVTPDAGGFASLALDAVPTGKSVTVQWITVRNVSASSGSSDIVSSTGAGVTPPPTVAVSQPQDTGNMIRVSTQYTMPGQTIDASVFVIAPQTLGTYTWEVSATTLTGAATDASVVVQGGATTGTFEVTAYSEGISSVASWIGKGSFSVQIAAACPDLRFVLRIKNQALTTIAASFGIEVDALGDKPAPAFPTVIPPPAIQTREPIKTDGQWPSPYAPSQVTMGMYAGGFNEAGDVIHVAVPPSSSPAFGAYYDPPDSAAEIWTAAQLVYGKPLKSQLGTITTYKVWK